MTLRGAGAQAPTFNSVKHGDRGKRVACAQKALQRGRIDPGPVNGIFGPKADGARDAQLSNAVMTARKSPSVSALVVGDLTGGWGG